MRRLPRLAPVAAVVLAIAAVAATVSVATVAQPTSSVVAAPPVVIAAPHTSAAAPSPGRTPPMRRAGRAPGNQPRVTFFGDSVSWTLGTYLPAHPGLTTTVRAVQGCGIATLPDILEEGTPHTNYDYCPAWPTIWRKGLAADDPDVSVVLLDRWELMDRRLNGTYQQRTATRVSFPMAVYLWENETLEVLPCIANPKYPPVKAIQFHTSITSKFYGDDYAVTGG